jgi:uncharacterized protein
MMAAKRRQILPINIIAMIIVVLAFCSAGWAVSQGLNSSDADGKRIGKWVIALDKGLNETEDSLNISYYKIANYVSGKAIGFVNYHYKSGKIYFQTPLKSSNPDVYTDGEIKFFSEPGIIIRSLNYIDGKLNGQAIYYYPDGKPQLQGNFTDNVRTGIWKQWNQNGGYGIGAFENEKPEGKWTFYYEDGSVQSEGKFHEGVQAGLWTEIRENGDTAIGIYLNGFPEGEWNCQFKNGKPCYQGSYIKGKREGSWKEWNVIGEMSQGSYANDKKTGNWKFFNQEGIKTMEGNYLDDLEDGEWVKYDSMGNVIESKSYSNGMELPPPSTKPDN